MMTPRLIGAVLAVATVCALGASPARAATAVSYPSSSCPQAADGLQSCIDAHPGFIVRIATDVPVDEFITISSSLTLTAYPGNHPEIVQGLLLSPAAVAAVEVSKIAVRGAVHVSVSSGHDHDVALDALSIHGGVVVDINDDGGSAVLVSNSTVTADPSSGAAFGVNFYAPGEVVAAGNEFIAPVTALQFTGVSAFQGNDGTNRLDLVGNTVDLRKATNAASGITVYAAGNGLNLINVMNNAIFKAATCRCGSSAGISITGTGAATSIANVVGDSIERSGTDGVRVMNQVAAGGHLSVNVFNTVVAHSHDGAISIFDSSGDASRVTLSAGYNDYYANGSPNLLGGRPGGSNNLKVNPKFADAAAGNLKLAAGSPLIDKGIVCSPGGVAIQDAAGRMRLKGASVDIGAFERKSGAVTGKAFVGSDTTADILGGTAGADIMCGYGMADSLVGSGGDDFVDGGAGPDFLYGDVGKDRLLGGPDGDTVCGGDGISGNDIVDGGTGTDTYSSDPNDTVKAAENKIPNGDCN